MMMFDHDTLIGDSATLTAIDNVVRQWQPERRGWILVDAEARQQVLVHVRSSVTSPNLPPRFRIGETCPIKTAAQLRSDAAADNHYVVVVARRNAQIGEAVANFSDALSRLNVKWIPVWFADGTLVTTDEDGEITSPVDLPQDPAVALSWTFEDDWRAQYCLPFSIAVESKESTALISVRIDGAADSFTAQTYEFSCRGVGSIGAGRLIFDLDPKVNSRDILTVSAVDFSGVVELAPAAITYGDFLPTRRAHLHVIVDRTLIDIESFSAGLFLEKDVSEDVFSPNKDQRPAWDQWNIRMRTALANALTEVVPRLQPPTQISLWWFADIERDGIAASRIDPPAGAFGTWGECDVTDLAGVLCGAPFSYKPGLDVFDAVDEALSAVASGIAQRLMQRPEKHSVLIVGDSPPPPCDESDVFWSALVDGPVRTSSRRSPLFHEALKTLARSNVQVGWLYLRAAVPPALDGPSDAAAFNRAQATRVRIYEALHLVPQLVVEACAGNDRLPAALERVLDRMNAAPRQSRFQLRVAV